MSTPAENGTTPPKAWTGSSTRYACAGTNHPAGFTFWRCLSVRRNRQSRFPSTSCLPERSRSSPSFDHVHALDHLAEDHMLAVEPRRLHGAEEELRAVGVRAGVGHAQDAGAGMLQLEILIGELLAVDRLAAGAVLVGEIAALAHEVWNDAVEGAAFVAEALFTGAERAEVLRRLGHDVRTQFNDHPPKRLAVGGDVPDSTAEAYPRPWRTRPTPR